MSNKNFSNQNLEKSNSDEKIRSVVSYLLREGMGNKTHMSKSLGICRKTVNKYIFVLLEKKILVGHEPIKGEVIYSVSNSFKESSVDSIINLMNS